MWGRRVLPRFIPVAPEISRAQEKARDLHLGPVENAMNREAPGRQFEHAERATGGMARGDIAGFRVVEGAAVDRRSPLVAHQRARVREHPAAGYAGLECEVGVTDDQDVGTRFHEPAGDIGCAGVTGEDAVDVGSKVGVTDRDPSAVDGLVSVRRQVRQELQRLARKVPADGVEELAPVAVASGRVAGRVPTDRPAVVIAADAGDAAVAQERDRLLWEESVIDEIPAAHDRVAAEGIDRGECLGQVLDVRVNVGEDRQSRHGRGSFRLAGGLAAAVVSALLALVATPTRAEYVFVTSSRTEADRKVFISNARTTSDCLIFISNSRTEAKDRRAFWFYTPNRTEATLRVFFTHNRSEADLEVFFTPNRTEAKCK